MQYIIDVLRKYGLVEAIRLDSFEWLSVRVLNGGFKVDLCIRDPKTMAIFDSVGDLVYSGAMPNSERFAEELLEHLGVPRTKK